MTHLFDDLDQASREFGARRWSAAAPLFERILAADSGNLMAAVRLAVSYSLLGRRDEALATFARAQRIAPESLDVRHYLAMHHLEHGEPERAAALLEEVLAAQPERLAALEGLARVRAAQGRLDDAAALLARAVPLAGDPAPLLVRLGELRMARGETAAAIDAFERARAILGPRFAHHLELGVLLLAARDLASARAALDQVPADHPQRAMALFKRAQVSVLLGEPDRADRVAAAVAGADETTRELVARERLFADLLPR
jgi:tetratricopeptide (TPR) repeat protein